MSDFIKLGRIEYSVIEIRDENLLTKSTKDLFCQPSQYDFNIDYTDQEKKTCKICLSDDCQEELNPLISPCNCKGSC